MRSHGTNLTVPKFRRLAVQSSVRTERKYWTFPCEGTVRSNFSAGSKIGPLPCEHSQSSVLFLWIVIWSGQILSILISAWDWFGAVSSCSMGQFWRGYRFLDWLFRGCAGNWVSIRPAKLSQDAIQLNRELKQGRKRWRENGELKQQRRRRLQKRHLKSEFMLLQTLSRLFHPFNLSNVGKFFGV